MADPSHIHDQSRFWRDVEPFVALDACWLWTNRIDRDGYGMFRYKQDGTSWTYAAHRVAYHLLVGSIPDGLVIDHLCRNRACVNPDHLEAVTNAENIRRGFGGRRRNLSNTCSRGHEFAPENTLIDRRGYRRCRACNSEAGRIWRERNRP